jgi:hypothetical protein
MRPFFKNDDFNFLTEIALGSVYWQAAVLVTDPDNEQFWPGQSRELFDRLAGETKAIIAFTQEEGADSHCEPAASGLRAERIFDWLDERIPA